MSNHLAEPAVQASIDSSQSTIRRARNVLAANPVLTCLVVFAALLRLSTLFWGLPIGYSGYYAADEPKLQWPAEQVLRMYGSVPGNPQYGTSVQYTIGLLVWPLRLVWRLIPPLEIRDHLLTWIALRGWVVVMGAATVAVTYRLAALLFSRPAALIAAALIAVWPTHVQMSGVVMLDVPMSFLLAVAAVLLIRAVERPTLFNIVSLGVASGYLVGTKVPTVMFCGVAAVLLVIGRNGDEAGVSERVVRLVRYACASIVTLLVTSPHYFFGLDKFLEKLLVHQEHTIMRVAPSWAHVVANSAESLLGFTGWPVAALIGIGVLGMGGARGRYKVAILAYVALLIAINRGFLASRYIVGFWPALAIFAGHGCWTLARLPSRLAPKLATGIATLLVIYLLAVCLNTIRSQYAETRTEAARFIAETYSDTTVAFSSVSEAYPWNIHRWRYPTLRSRTLKVVGILEQPDVIVTSSIDMNAIESALRSPHLSREYRWDPQENHVWYRSTPPSPRLFRFYDDLLSSRSEYRLVKSFSFDPQFPSAYRPPTIRIYERGQ